MLLANWKTKLYKGYDFGLRFLILLLIFILSFAFSVDNFFLFYVFFELSLVPTFLLILG